MVSLRELKNDIAASLFICPCAIEELEKAEFLKNKSSYGVGIMCNLLYKDGAMYYKGDVMHIKKSWAKANLTDGYDLDFRSEMQKEFDGMTDFKKAVVKAGYL